MSIQKAYDVAIIGAGPVGCVTALAFAKQGKSVLILEANPRSKERLAGEWLHPPALDILRSLGVDFTPSVPYMSGRGFAVFPDDGSRTVILPYEVGQFGMSFEHHRLVECLRKACEAHAEISLVNNVRAQVITGQNLTFESKTGHQRTITAQLIVGASGRSSIVHTALGLSKNTTSYSRMAGLILSDVELPFEGYGHVFLGGPGPALAYRIAPNKIRLCLDIPLDVPVNRGKEAILWDGFSWLFPKEVKSAFRRALEADNVSWAANQIRSRCDLGREGLVLVGDAAGHTHPLTAVGMTLGFADAMSLAQSKSFPEYKRDRLRKSRVPEMLAIALYEVFADASDETVSMRRAVYELWRAHPEERLRTMGFLSGMDTKPSSFARSFMFAMSIGARHILKRGIETGRWDYVKNVSQELGDRMRWLFKGTMHLSQVEPTKERPPAEQRYGVALKASRSRAEVVEHPSFLEHIARRAAQQITPQTALERGTRALIAHQAGDGSWEGEVVWCPMLAAQYVMTQHILGRPISEDRRRRILKHFERTQRPDGLWGLHEVSEPYLFVTTLVYVAARLLEVDAKAPLLDAARRFIQAQDVVNIPSWGKFWLAMLNLYGWEGVNPVSPRVWQLPKWTPLHPSRYYCHTRNIYMGMAVIYAARLQAHCAPILQKIRSELYPRGYENVRFDRTKDKLRDAEIHTPPSSVLKLSYRALSLLERVPMRKSTQSALLEELRDHIRYELRTTSHTSISPVSGLLNIIGLWAADPEDVDAQRALERFEGWVWEDEVDGMRVTGARSITWDTSFAVQALAEAEPHTSVSAALERADTFLKTQQIPRPFGGEERFHRLDPSGGYCFAGIWHGWPVSDCTAEALIARMDSPEGAPTVSELVKGVQFILRTQNSDGGFGSYEARRLDLPLEWLNPAEMFGDSMLEHSYVECTASCITALSTFRDRHPDLLRSEIDQAIERAVHRIRQLQRPDGCWEGNWGIHFIYGTMFGIRGLLAGGIPPQDPDVRRACQWLLARQNDDGGWGERKAPPGSDFVKHDHSQIVQTSWALSALLKAHEPSWEPLDRAAHFLASRQLANGEWPKQDPVGIFFHTAHLDYVLYRAFFPIHALGLYETRRVARDALLEARHAATG